MPDVDLDAAHAARQEVQNGAGPSITLGGKKYPLKSAPPVVIGLSYAALFADGATVESVKTFLRHSLARPADVDKVLDAGFMFADATLVLDAWKVAEGESSASARSSAKSGTRSRPTSTTRTRTTRSPKGSGKKP